jgi:CBS domain-containing protein
LRRLNAHAAGPAFNPDGRLPDRLERRMSVTVVTLATPIIVSVTPETTAMRAAQMMREQHVGCLVVVEPESSSGKPLGIVTDRDLVLSIMAEELDPALFTIGDVMSADPVTVSADATLLDAVALMREHRLRRLVVVDGVGRVVGLAALEDVLEALTREFAELVLALRGARDRECKDRR